MRLKLATILVSALLVLVWANTAQGFGVSPPFVKEEHLLPGSQLEKIIYLTRSEPNEDYKAELEFSPGLKEIENWIKIGQGMEFTIPAGTKQFPLKIGINVPGDAKLGQYKGYIWISGKPEKVGQVTTITGGTIELNLKVTDQEYSDWRLRDLGVRDLGKNEKTIKVYLKVENLGNVKARPSKVHLDVYDNYHQNLLSSGDNTELDWIPPFQTKEITVGFPVDLEPAQQYWAEIEIYKDGEILLADKRRFNVGEIATKEVSSGQVSEPLKESEKLEAGLEFGFLKNKIFLFGLLGVVLIVGLGFGIRQIRKSGIGLEIKMKKKATKKERVKGKAIKKSIKK